MPVQGSLNRIPRLDWQHALVDVEVFCANKEFVTITLSKVNTMSIYKLAILGILGRCHAASHVEAPRDTTAEVL